MNLVLVPEFRPRFLWPCNFLNRFYIVKQPGADYNWGNGLKHWLWFNKVQRQLFLSVPFHFLTWILFTWSVSIQNEGPTYASIVTSEFTMPPLLEHIWAKALENICKNKELVFLNTPKSWFLLDDSTAWHHKTGILLAVHLLNKQ